MLVCSNAHHLFYCSYTCLHLHDVLMVILFTHSDEDNSCIGWAEGEEVTICNGACRGKKNIVLDMQFSLACS